jgi:YD repeat-containing protein
LCSKIEKYKYDANGNITTLQRTRMSGNVAVATQRIDNLSYHYNNENNRLSSITDAVTTNAIDTDDLKNQVGNNYLYDEIGNLTQDIEGKNQIIEWTAYGKVSKVVKSDGKEITYRYDATGQRISKTFEGKTTFYVRDASGNVMATYEAPQPPAGGVLKELMIYGSARVGVYNGKSERMKAVLGNKNYELSNHLGNVLVTITDNKFIATVGVFVAKVNSTTDYYPFGMAIVERTWKSEEYRYGFNTQEKDFEIDKSGNHTTAEFWEYDSRSGRRWNVDPVVKPWESLYACLSNSPIWIQDILGDDGEVVGPKPKFLKPNFFKPAKYKSKPDVEGADQHYLGDLLPESWKNGILEKILGSKGLNLAQQYGKWHNENLNALANLFRKGKKGVSEIDDATSAALKKVGLDPDNVTKIQTEVSFKVITKDGKEVDVRLDAVAQTKDGKFIPIEVKTGNASLSYGQEAFAKVMAEGGQIIPKGDRAFDIFEQTGKDVMEKMTSKLKLIRFDGMIPRQPLGGVER